MRPTLAALFAGFVSIVPFSAPAQSLAYDHVVVVILENHSYQEILEDAGATYINGTLRPNSANITGSYGLQHPSQPNYYWLFSGYNQGITTDTPPSSPVYSTPNLYTVLTSQGLTFGGYAEYYPGQANQYNDSTNYAVRHVPWLGFSNIPSNLTQDFTSFPTTEAGYASLPTVSFVIPGLNHDMHDYDNSGNEVSDQANSTIAINNGDAWLQENMDGYIQWAKTHNSLFILTTDEDSSADWATPPAVENADDLTASNLGPNASGPSGPNQITTIFAGANIVAGDYAEGNGITGVNVLRTLESFYGLTPNGGQSELALAAGATDLPIADIFAVPEPSSVALLVAGVLGVAWKVRKRGSR